MKRIFFWAVFFGITASGYADAQSDLFEEVRKGNLENAEKIYSVAPESFDNTDSRGRSAVFYAIESGNPNMLKFVLDRNNRIDVPDNSGEYPIHFAAKYPDSKIIDLVLNRDSYLNYLTRNGENALDIATYYGNHSVVAYLSAKGMKQSKPVSGPYTIGLYFGYLIISILMTIWVARTLFNNGRIFLVKMFNGEEKLADSINHLLIVGFYLINVGYISLSLTSSQKPLDLAECIEVLTTKVGVVLLILGAMHFFNLFLFAKFRKKISHTFGEVEVPA
ncbi:ankyrin repeat domain-containing protein [Leptospira kmetyi]|uniref:ankyrin repeat domain-containing protein n=1 Tax=Leptospira kmetyi TaxID=408139 RepID=UPI0010825E16|nr:ankyrin repeat domain-containing protein [Leptospira kmetyi]TGK16646.1 ankyrin repeat domain-containing protein [Leptospira kmetyi]TGK33951.1 ankyrin repeat domain-containing protein [Leptospira kmetyi]